MRAHPPSTSSVPLPLRLILVGATIFTLLMLAPVPAQALGAEGAIAEVSEAVDGAAVVDDARRTLETGGPLVDDTVDLVEDTIDVVDGAVDVVDDTVDGAVDVVDDVVDEVPGDVPVPDDPVTGGGGEPAPDPGPVEEPPVHGGAPGPGHASGSASTNANPSVGVELRTVSTVQVREGGEGPATFRDAAGGSFTGIGPVSPIDPAPPIGGFGASDAGFSLWLVALAIATLVLLHGGILWLRMQDATARPEGPGLPWQPPR